MRQDRGAISGLDKIRFCGKLRWLASERGLMFLVKGGNAINGFGNHDLRKWLYRES